jgi:hypothetical protein
MHVLVEPSLGPPDPQGLLQAFSAGKRDLSWVEDLPRADRAVVAHAIARRFAIVTTDAAMKETSFKEFLKRLERTQDAKLPPWRLPSSLIAKRGVWH